MGRPGHATAAVHWFRTDHLAELQSGQVPGKPNLHSDILWEKPSRTAPQPPRLGAEPRDFQYGDSILQILVGDVEPNRRLTQSLDRGLLESEAGPARTSWRVPQSARAEVAAKCVIAVRSAGDGAVDLLRALGEWEYFGGLSELDYDFDAAVVPIAEAALRGILAADGRSDFTSPLDLSSTKPFPECFLDIRHYVNANAPGDFELRPVPGLAFVSDILWRLVPKRLVAIALEIGGSRIPAWLATNISRVGDARPARCHLRLNQIVIHPAAIHRAPILPVRIHPAAIHRQAVVQANRANPIASPIAVRRPAADQAQVAIPPRVAQAAIHRVVHRANRQQVFRIRSLRAATRPSRYPAVPIVNPANRPIPVLTIRVPMIRSHPNRTVCQAYRAAIPRPANPIPVIPFQAILNRVNQNRAIQSRHRVNRLARVESHKGWRQQYRMIDGKPMPFDSSPKAAWKICLQRSCTQLFQGHLWKCPALAYFATMERKLRLEAIPAWHLFRDYKACPPTASDDVVREFFATREIPQCGLCPARKIPFHHQDPTNKEQ